MNKHVQIKKDKLIWKFSFYGLLKNLRFFEPYLYIYFLNLDFSLFQIGLLLSIRQIVVYLTEIPSGVFADNYGKKTSLLICFISYLISFVFFFLTRTFLIAATGMLFFAIGEAFRSGTHKSIIYSYLEEKGWFNLKTYVYCITRSFSLIGTFFSVFLSIILVLNIPNLKWIFLITMVPYILDFFLVFSYPNYLNEKTQTSFNLKKFFKLLVSNLKSLFSKKLVKKYLLNSSIYDSIFKSSKDYIQPIIKNIAAVSGIYIIGSYTQEENMKILLGLIYGFFYIFNAIASRNSYLFQKKFKSSKFLNISFDLMGFIFILLAIVTKFNIVPLIIFLFFIFALKRNIRKPMVVDVFGNITEKNERATIHSIDSQLRSIFMVFIAPLLGFFADNFSISTAFLIFGVIIFIINIFLKKD